MLNPLSLPSDVLEALRSVGRIERLLDERLALVDERLRELDARIDGLPAELERTLRPHLEGQNESIRRASSLENRRTRPFAPKAGRDRCRAASAAP